MAQASGRRNNTFESRLISQLPLVDALLYSVATDYVWLVDGDISFKPTDIPGLEALLAAKGDDRVLAAQPAIDAAPDKPKTSSGGDLSTSSCSTARWRRRCARAAASTCCRRRSSRSRRRCSRRASSRGTCPAPLRRRDAGEGAERVGPDMLWCGAATRYASIASPPPGCRARPLLRAPSSPSRCSGDDTEALDRTPGERDERGAAPPRQAREPRRSSSPRDFVAIDHVNEWWDGVAGDCERLKGDRRRTRRLDRDF